jgi:transposase-like protein
VRSQVWSVEERGRLVAAFHASGLSAKAFAEREGVPSSTMYQWLAKSRQAVRDVAPVRIARVIRRRAEPAAQAASGAATSLVIELGDVSVRVAPGFDRDSLQSVLDVIAVRDGAAAR